MSEPMTITLSQVSALLGGLGLDSDISDLRSVAIEPGMVTVVRHRRHEGGGVQVLAGLNEIATVTTTISIVEG